ncbi:fibrobacter succinogenes major paralogous domain-containing protein [Polaribacter sp. MSW13]|uniref:Fibrobacter succinogenes major paralogous domain-containing protein n=1 Tax=Polaribacter marinus TaxID=2916838 RepID=A0A9X1VRM8_9FLAO|nr:fibrobacter succinogenes major paralogous domain-containing protein [Polaribacter marinus]MCI2228271.1 fibrobacter succinogenes major paralogous domain-containing protein [Polaribacter marinus]
MKKILLSAAFIAVSFTMTAQVGIGTTTVETSAALEIKASDKALLLPRVANTLAITTPVDGMIVYDISTSCVRFYDKGNWSPCLSPAAAGASATIVLAQIGAEGDDPNTVPSIVTIDQLNQLGLNNVVVANEAAYQAYIDANPDMFANPATKAEVQNMVNTVNIAAIVAASNDPADGTPSIADLTAVGVTGMNPANIAQYEVAINNASPAPTTLAELQAIININEDTLAGLIASAEYPVAGLTEAQFTNAGATGLVTANVAAYEAYTAQAEPKPTTLAGLQAIVDEVNTFVSTNAADVVISTTGAIWANKNLGASQVATSSTDAASYGNHYQWGKAQAFTNAYSTANNVAGPVASAAVAGTNFVTNGTAPYDWITPANDFLWNSGTEANPTKTAADPCPTNYRVPTYTELTYEKANLPTANAAGAFASPLKLPVAGARTSSTGALNYVGTYGNYWSSTVSGTTARTLNFNSSTATMTSTNRAYGFSVRCIKE